MKTDTAVRTASFVLCFLIILFSTHPSQSQMLVIGGGTGYQHILRVAPGHAPFQSIQAAIDSISDAA